MKKFIASFFPIKAHTKCIDNTRGYFENIENNGNRLLVSGWILNPHRKLESCRLYVDNVMTLNLPVIIREDVGNVFHFIKDAKFTGFRFEFNVDNIADNWIDIKIAGVSNNKEVAFMDTWYKLDLFSMIPTPPSTLISRVAAHESTNAYLATGVQNYKDYWGTICKYKDPKSINDILDWGCGCGRITSFFLKYSNIPNISGCDIDGEAISWCSANLNPADFTVIRPYPPTSYADNSFDLIISFSVFTHLNKENQLLWLKEMKRILKPNGLFLASVHGEFATSFCYPENYKQLLIDGIYDEDDTRLDGIAPNGYYRGTYQKKEYTINAWKPYFEILDYIEAKAGNYQDLVVMKKNSF